MGNKILLISTAAMPTVYPFEGYGGIERIVADLAHSLVKKGYEVIVVGAEGSSINKNEAEIVTVSSENDMEHLGSLESQVNVAFDFSHLKKYPGEKFSIPFWSDSTGKNPIYPTQAVMRAFEEKNGRVIYPGIDLSKYRVGEPDKYYVYLGRIVDFKGVLEALRIAKYLTVPIKIIGHTGKFADKDYVELVKWQCSSYKKAEFIENVSEEEKVELLSHAKGMLFFPHWERLHYKLPNPIESFGINVLEALASGVPVFTNRNGGHVELVMSAVGGDLIDDDYPPDYSKAMMTPRTMKDRVAISKRANSMFSSDEYAKQLVWYAKTQGRDIEVY